MSSTPPSMFSPLGNRRSYESLIDAGRWTVDNSESRFTQFTSPIRSILKGSHTPQRYKSPLFQHEQEKRRERLAQRRVSFAPDAHLRLFQQDDTPDISTRDVPNIIEESEPTVMLTEAFATPLVRHQEDSPFLARLSGSPSDRRKRRPDLFGSPPGNSRSPKRRSGGQPPSLLNRVYDESEDNGSDLTQYLSLQHQKGPRNIFEEDEDDDDNDENQDQTIESMVLTQTIDPPTRKPSLPSGEAVHGTIPTQTVHTLEKNTPSLPSGTSESMVFTETTNSRARQSPSPPPTMNPLARQSPSPPPTIQTMNPLARRSRSSQPFEDMFLTQTTNTPAIQSSSSSPSPPLSRSAEPMVSSLTNVMSPLTKHSILPSPSQPFESTLITQANNINNPLARRFSPSPSPPVQQQEEERRRSSPLISSSPLLNQQNLDINLEDHLEYKESKKAGEEEKEKEDEEEFEFDIPLADDDNMQLTHELPLVGSPSRLTHSPFRPLQPQPQQNDMSGMYSPHRSFYLHDKSPLSQERFNDTVKIDHMLSLQNLNDDLLEEEFPETYQSFTDMPPLSDNISLEEFLCVIGMTFNDLIPTKQLRRRSTYNIDYGSATLAEQAVAAASTLPQLDLFQSGCNQLNQYIRDCKQTIQNIHETVSDANPQFFSEYNEASPQLRSQMEKRFLLIKNYARLKANTECCEWWSNTLQELLKTLQANHEKLMQDEQSMEKFETKLRSQTPLIEKFQDDLQRRLAEARIEEEEYHAIDHAQLNKLEQEIEQQRYSIQAFKKEADKLENIEFELVEKTVVLEKRKSDLKETISQAEALLVDNECISVKDLIDAAELFNKCSEINKWKLEKAENDVIEVSISEDINVIVDRTKLQQKSEDAVLVRMLDSRDRELGPLAELVHGLKITAKNKWDMNEIIQDIAIYWNRVRMMQYELEKIQRRFWVDITALENADEPDEAGFSCQICVYSFMGKTKFTVSFQVNPKDILDYPFIDLSTLEVDLNYGCIEYSELEELLQKSISETGFTDLANTLRNILEQISIPSS